MSMRSFSADFPTFESVTSPVIEPSAPKKTTQRHRFKSFIPVLAVALGFTITACSPVVPMNAAEDAGSVECANVQVRLPDRIDTLKKRTTNAQSTAAYGDPEAVLIRCGVEMPVVSDIECFDVNGVDWLADASREPDYVFISYGRDPAMEVIVDNTQIAGRTVLEELTSSALALPQKHSCLSLDEAEESGAIIGN